MASSSASALLASAANSNNATDSGLDEDTSNESLNGTEIILGFHNANTNAHTSNHEQEAIADDIVDEYSEDDHDCQKTPPAPPTSPTSASSHVNHHLTLEDYSLLPEADQHLSELQQFEANQPLIHRPFHMGRLDLDRIDPAATGSSGGEMEFSELKLEEPATSASPDPTLLFPGKFNQSLESSVQQSNSNECKALIKFELPTSAQFLPNIVCDFQSHQRAESNYYRSLHVDTAHHHYKQLQLHTFTEVPSSTSGSMSMCRALIPYEQRELHKKDRVVFGYTLTNAGRDLKLSDESRNLSALTKRSARRLRDNWNNLKKEHAEARLRSAANAGNLDIVKNILNNKLYDVNPNAQDEMGRTALHMAAAKGCTDIVAALLESGASPNRKDSLGNTPLHLAACTNHFSVVTRLLRAGTDISQLDNHGRNPLQLAKAKLRILAQSKSNSNDLIRIKKEVQQIIEMMMEYLQKKGQDEEVELLNAFASQLTLQQGDDDVKSLLANLSNLSLSGTTKNEQLLHHQHQGQTSSPAPQSGHHHQSIT